MYRVFSRYIADVVVSRLLPYAKPISIRQVFYNYDTHTQYM